MEPTKSVKSKRGKKRTFIQIVFENWSEDYTYTIVENMKDAMQYLQIAEDCMNDGEDTKVRMRPIKMTDRQYDNWIKTIER